MTPPQSKTPRQIPLAATACSLLSALLAAAPGCSPTRVVTVPSTEPRQLAETVSAYVYVRTKDGQRIRSANRTPLFEGEWVLSDPGSK